MTESPAAPAPAGHSTTFRLLLVLILLFSSLIQLTVVSQTKVDVPLRADSGEYFSYAYNLRTYGVYSIARTWAEYSPAVPKPDAFRPPGYPLFLAMVGKPEPLDWYLRRVSLVQAALGVLSVWLIYLISAQFLGRGWSLAVALITAISPHLAIISTLLLSESLFFFLLLAATFTLLKAIQGERRSLYAATGVLWGLCSLVRPTAELFPVVMLLAVMLLPRLRSLWASALLGFVCFAAVFAPWTLRNLSAGVDKPAASLMVKSLAHGSYPGFMYEDKPESFGFPYRFDPDSERNARDLPSILKHIAGRFRAEPLRYANWYLIGKPRFFLSWGNVQGRDILIHPVTYTPYYEDRRFWRLRQLAFVLHWPLMVLGLLGALLLLKPKTLGLDRGHALAAGTVACLVIYAIGFHMIVAPFPRYGIPFWPLLYALAMLPVRAAWMRLHHPQVGHLY